MKDIFFSENLDFHTYIRSNDYHTDQYLGAPRHYFAYMEKGNCRIVSQQHTIEASAGDVFYIPKGLVYHSYWYAEDKVQFKSFGFHYFPESNTRQYLLQTILCSEDVKSLIRSIPTDQPVDSDLLGRFYRAIAAALPFMEYDVQDTKQAIIEKAKQYILANVTCSIPDIARHCLISEAALYDIFKKNAGCTPNELRQQILCEKAVLLLSTTDQSVQAISDTLHFSSPSYFRKVLLKCTGKTPRQIRQSTKNI